SGSFAFAISLVWLLIIRKRLYRIIKSHTRLMAKAKLPDKRSTSGSFAFAISLVWLLIIRKSFYRIIK
ncbi:hypothetical protein PSZ24_23760, partial [Shigella flexneri]|nr:hypothetical protein [Shigella flexneri]